MVQGVSPVVARRRLRLELRRAREQREITQGQVGAALEWSLSKVQRIESGDVTVSRTDLVALLTYLGVTSKERIDELSELARTARKRITHWWDEAQYKESLTPATIKFIELENEATEIRCFHSTLVPGLLQTPEYAQLIFDSWQHELSSEQLAIRHESRLRRQREFWQRPDRAKFLLLLDESVLLRDMGNPEIMAGQFRHLLTLMDSGRIGLRLVPLTEAPIAGLNPFLLLTFLDGDTVIYREAHTTDEIIESESMINLVRQRFERMWEAALTERRCREVIDERAMVMLRTASSRDGVTYDRPM